MMASRRGSPRFLLTPSKPTVHLRSGLLTTRWSGPGMRGKISTQVRSLAAQLEAVGPPLAMLVCLIKLPRSN